VTFGDLPKTSTGKIQKFVLRDNAWAARNAGSSEPGHEHQHNSETELGREMDMTSANKTIAEKVAAFHAAQVAAIERGSK